MEKTPLHKKSKLTQALAISGTVFSWIPILFPILLSLVFFIQQQRFQLDYLMPAELFPSALLGSILLLWAAIRTKTYLKLFGWGAGLAVACLLGAMGLAEVTGLASGATQPTTLLMALVILPLGMYTLALVAMGVGGVLLIRDTFTKQPG